MGALNYALELETHVLVPLRRPALGAHRLPRGRSTPSRRKRLRACFWTLHNERAAPGCRCSPPCAAAGADRSTAARPMADYTLQDAMELALDTPGIDGVVMDPWSNSATLDGALLNGLLHAGHTPEEPGARRRKPVRKPPAPGHWAAAAECYEKAAEQGSSPGYRCWASACIRGAAYPKALHRRARCGKLLPKAASPSPF